MESAIYDTGAIGIIQIKEHKNAIVKVNFLESPEESGSEYERCRKAAEQCEAKDNVCLYCWKNPVSGDLEFKEILESNEGEGTLIRKACVQIDEYLAGEREEFVLPIRFVGTHFQEEVWCTLLEIPYGETWTYTDVAKAVGRPKACRAVGLANNRNPIPLIIPCHRVIGTNGRLTGYGGGLDVKETLLDIERARTVRGRMEV